VRFLPPTISAVQARKLIIGGDQAFLAFVVTPTKQAKKNLEEILVVCEYPDVFSMTILDYHHKGRWSLGLSMCHALILSLRHRIGWHRRS
jgi:hypothetical protein